MLKFSQAFNGTYVPQGSQVVSVQDAAYGAKGDGVTNDAPAIQAAINACPVGGTVYFPPAAAYYSVSATIVVPSYIRLLGNLGYTNYVAYAAEGSVIRQASGSNLDAVVASYNWYHNVTSGVDLDIQIEKLAIDGNRRNQTGGLGYGVAHMCYRFRMKDSWVLGTYSHNVLHATTDKGTTFVGTTVEGYYEDNIFYDSGGEALHVQGGATDGFFVNNVVQSPISNGINIASLAGWKIDGNHFYGVGADNIVATGASGAVIADNYLELPGIQQTSGGAARHMNLTIGSGSPADSLVIHGNHMRLDSAATAGVTYQGVILTVSATTGTYPVEMTGNGVDGYVTTPYGTAYIINVASGATVNLTTAGNNALNVSTIYSAPGSGIINISPDVLLNKFVYKSGAYSTYTMSIGDVLYCASASNGTITLPTPFLNGMCRLTNTGAGTVTVTVASGSLFSLSGGTGNQTYAQGTSASFLSDGTNWLRIS
jgi:hypothetical protein